jgi:hypothetical protein
MIVTALAWKEYREHRAIWVAMTAFSGLAVGALTLWQSASLRPTAEVSLPLTAAAFLCWAYGAICGSMLLAGEDEEGTLAFLETLPAQRQQLWSTKFFAGVALVLAQALLLGTLAVGWGFLGLGSFVTGTGGIALVGLAGLGWGLFFSARGEHVLHAIAKAVGAQILAGLGLALLVVIGSLLEVRPTFGDDSAAPLVLGLDEALLVVGACVGSQRTFCKTDRLRREAASPSQTGGRPRIGWISLLWLCWRQARLFTAGLMVFSLAVGVLLLAGGAWWSLATLLVGIAAGVATYAGEQKGTQAALFLGDQRLPEVRVWLVKTAVYMVVALTAALAVLLPSVAHVGIRDVFSPQNRPGLPSLTQTLLGESMLVRLTPSALFLGLWVLHGFALGQLCGLVIRSTILASACALAFSLLSVALWLPSLLGGGVHFWQPLGVPVLALLASLLVWPARAAGRPASQGTVLRLAACGLLALLWSAWGLAYRVLEVRQGPHPVRPEILLARLPALEDNEVGPRTQAALAAMDRRFREIQREHPTKPLFDVEDPTFLSIHIQLNLALERGLPRADTELGKWLDRLFAVPWASELAQAAELPPGPVDDPRQQSLDSISGSGAALTAARFLVLEGLQRQLQGNDKAFLANLTTGLALTRNVRFGGGHFAAHLAQQAETTLLKGLGHWLERLHHHSDLLRKAQALLQEHLEKRPADTSDEGRADFFVACKALELPEDWFPRTLRGTRPSPTELAAAKLAWQLPWERARLLRLLQRRLNPAQGNHQDTIFGNEWLAPVQDRIGFSPNDRGSLASVRAGILQLALRAYQEETGRPAATLDCLVPKYLPEQLHDPFAVDSRPFGYRLSAGEKIDFPKANNPGEERYEPRLVPAGQGILWSVGPDQRDNGGRRHQDPRPEEQETDLIFLVPLPLAG